MLSSNLQFIALHTIVFLTYVTFYWSCVEDPGKVPQSYKPSGISTILVFSLEGTEQELQKAIEEEESLPKERKSARYHYHKHIRWCKKCSTFKSPRTHHCSVCNRCVLKMDHHCPYIDQCVGYKNHKLFILFLFYGNTSMLWDVLICLTKVYGVIFGSVSSDSNVKCIDMLTGSHVCF